VIGITLTALSGLNQWFFLLSSFPLGLAWSALNIAILPLLAITLLMLSLQRRPRPV
jgi:hypothetical protein